MTAPAKTRDELLEAFHAQCCQAYPGTAECVRFEQTLDAVLAAERERCAMVVDEMATRARSQKRSAHTNAARESGAVAEYALSVAVTAVRGLK